MHISSSHAEILGETNFHTREIPRSGSKAKDGERERRGGEREARIGARKPPGPIDFCFILKFKFNHNCISYAPYPLFMKVAQLHSC